MQPNPISQKELNQLLSPAAKKRFWSMVKIGTKKQCWPWTGKCSRTDGYVRTSLLGHMHYVHRLAWMLHNKKAVPIGLMILHSCVDCERCCNPSHLRPGDQFDNMRDRTKHGRTPHLYGEAGPQAKLTNGQVIKIRKLYATGKYSHPQLGRMFGIDGSYTWKIVRKINWPHI